MEVSPSSTRVPALATNKVASVFPGHLVPAAGTHGVGGLAASVGPPGVEVAVMGAHRVGRYLAPLQGLGRVPIVALEEVVRTAKHGSDSRHSKEERFERDHGDEKQCLMTVGCV